MLQENINIKRGYLSWELPVLRWKIFKKTHDFFFNYETWNIHFDMDFSFEKFCNVVLGFVQKYQIMQIINLWKAFFHSMLVKSQNFYSMWIMWAFLINFSFFFRAHYFGIHRIKF